MLAVPVSLIGTFAGLWLLGFSINTLTLFAHGARHRHRGRRRDRGAGERRAPDARGEDGRRSRPRSRRCARSPGAVIAIVLVLCAVFVPVAFLGGIAGQLYRQFAVTVTVAVVISGFIALTLTPALCALLLQAGRARGAHLPPVQRRLRQGHEALPAARSTLALRAPRSLARLAFLAVMLALSSACSCACPRSFVPAEDQGYLIGSMQLPDGATLAAHAARPARSSSRSSQATRRSQHAFVVAGLRLHRRRQQDQRGARSFVPAQGLGRARRARRRRSRRDLSKASAGLHRRHRDRLQPARRSAAWAPRAASSSTCRRAPTPTRSSLGAGDAGLHRGAARRTRAHRHQHVLPPDARRSCTSR